MGLKSSPIDAFVEKISQIRIKESSIGAGHLQEPFFVGIFSMTMADDAFYGGLVCIVSAKI